MANADNDAAMNAYKEAVFAVLLDAGLADEAWRGMFMRNWPECNETRLGAMSDVKIWAGDSRKPAYVARGGRTLEFHEVNARLANIPKPITLRPFSL